MLVRFIFQWLFVAALSVLSLSSCMSNPVSQSLMWVGDQLKYVADIVACLLMACLMAFLLVGLPYISKRRESRQKHHEPGRWD
jgi:uncharacterized membrane-anchored protein